jgi:hypothetical protein
MSLLHNISAHHAALNKNGTGTVGPGEFSLVSAGIAWIDTGVVPSGSFTYEAYLRLDYTGPNFLLWPGGVRATSPYGRAYSLLVDDDQFTIAWGSGTVTVHPIFPRDNEWHTFRRENGICYIDNEGRSTPDYAGDNLSFYIFASNEDGDASHEQYRSSCRYFKSWTDATKTSLTRDMWAVPTGLKATGATTTAPSNCMYDAVTDTYFENQGTGSFAIEAVT